MKAQPKVFYLIGGVLLLIMLSLLICFIYSRINTSSTGEKQKHTVTKDSELTETTNNGKRYDQLQLSDDPEAEGILDNDSIANSTDDDEDEEVELLNDCEIVPLKLQTQSDTEIGSTRLESPDISFLWDIGSPVSDIITPISVGTNDSITTLELENLLLQNGFVLKKFDIDNDIFEESRYPEHFERNVDHVDLYDYKYIQKLAAEKADVILSEASSPVTIASEGSDQSNDSFVKL